MIILRMFAASELEEKVCNLYWHYDPDKGFRYGVEEIADMIGISAWEVEEIAAESCLAFWGEHVCSLCSAPLMLFKSREDFLANWDKIAKELEQKNKGAKILICPGCEEKGALNLCGFPGLKISARKTRAMKEAFLNAFYQFIEPWDLELFKSMAKAESLNEAAEKEGLSYSRALRTMRELVELDLVALEQQELGYWMLPEMAQLLQRNLEAVKPVFDSCLDQEIYSWLKRKYLFVYSKLPPCAFIPEDQVKDQLGEDWKKSCYLSYELDFVVCTFEGVPVKVLERESKEGAKDQKFIRKLLKQADIPLKIVRKKG